MRPLLRTYLDVKVAGDDFGPGEFEAILSTPRLDRDGEILDAGCFNPLPKILAIHREHRIGLHELAGSAEPFYDGDVLKAKGKFSRLPPGQETRQLLLDGHPVKMSVGFRGATRAMKGGVPHVTKGELVEASFCSVPANIDADVTGVKSGRPDGWKAAEGSFEHRAELLTRALREFTGHSLWVRATFDDRVVFESWGPEEGTFEMGYKLGDDGLPVLSGEPSPVVLAELVRPAKSGPGEKTGFAAALDDFRRATLAGLPRL